MFLASVNFAHPFYFSFLPLFTAYGSKLSAIHIGYIGKFNLLYRPTILLISNKKSYFKMKVFKYRCCRNFWNVYICSNGKNGTNSSWLDGELSVWVGVFSYFSCWKFKLILSTSQNSKINGFFKKTNGNLFDTVHFGCNSIVNIFDWRITANESRWVKRKIWARWFFQTFFFFFVIN